MIVKNKLSNDSTVPFYKKSTIHARNEKRLQKIRASREAARKDRISLLNWWLTMSTAGTIANDSVSSIKANFDSHDFSHDGIIADDDTRIEGLTHEKPLTPAQFDKKLFHATLGGSFGGFLESKIGRTRNDVLNRLSAQIISSLRTNAVATENTHSMFAMMGGGNVAASPKVESTAKIYKFGNGFNQNGGSPSSINTKLRWSHAKNGVVLTSIPSAGILFGTFSYFCGALNVDCKTAMPSDWNLISASFMTGIVTSSIFTPFELIRSRLLYKDTLSLHKHGVHLGSTPANSVLVNFNEFVSILRKEGFATFYNGFRQVYARETVGNIAYFSTYVFVRRALEGAEGSSSKRRSHPNYLHVGVAGGAAGLVFWSIAYPFDMLRTIVQTQPSNSFMQSNGKAICNRLLYQGYLSCLLRAVPANAALFLGYELFMNTSKH